ncbi:MAG: hypothetical protein K0R43_2550 [Pseudoduganella sp.]|jgi:hypothetical protein|nr:hypothetical protein [Pseudoduganella sp.]
MALDPHKLRLQVFEKTGIRVDVDDPIFALVALNEAVLEETVERHLARLDAASADLAEQLRAGAGLAPAGGAHVPPPASGGVRPIATSHAAFSPRELRLLAAAAAVAVLAALLVLAGQALFSGPGASERAALERAARLDKALPRLDPKVRAALQAELDKP